MSEWSYGGDSDIGSEGSDMTPEQLASQPIEALKHDSSEGDLNVQAGQGDTVREDETQSTQFRDSSAGQLDQAVTPSSLDQSNASQPRTDSRTESDPKVQTGQGDTLREESAQSTQFRDSAAGQLDQAVTPSSLDQSSASQPRTDSQAADQYPTSKAESPAADRQAADRGGDAADQYPTSKAESPAADRQAADRGGDAADQYPTSKAESPAAEGRIPTRIGGGDGANSWERDLESERRAASHQQEAAARLRNESFPGWLADKIMAGISALADGISSAANAPGEHTKTEARMPLWQTGLAAAGGEIGGIVAGRISSKITVWLGRGAESAGEALIGKEISVSASEGVKGAAEQAASSNPSRELGSLLGRTGDDAAAQMGGKAGNNMEQGMVRGDSRSLGVDEVARTDTSSPLPGVTAETEAAVERAFTETAQADIQSVYRTTANLAKGNFGERMAADVLATDGHEVLFFKPSILGTNQGGIDIYAYRDGIVYLIDNKAFTSAGNISSVSSLTTNLTKNIATAERDLAAMAADVARPAAEREMIRGALTALQDGHYVKAVTNAALIGRDATAIKTGVTQTLADQGIHFINVFP